MKRLALTLLLAAMMVAPASAAPYLSEVRETATYASIHFFDGDIFAQERSPIDRIRRCDPCEIQQRRPEVDEADKTSNACIDRGVDKVFPIRGNTYNQRNM